MNTREMTLEELMAEAEAQRKAATDAAHRASICEAQAIELFLLDNGLRGIVIHNKSGKKGRLRITSSNRGDYQVNFYPLKKNGEESENRSIDCTEWDSWRKLKENFETMLQAYSSANESEE